MCKGYCCGKWGCTVSVLVKVLVVVGAVNWGLVGLGMFLGSYSGWNIVGMLLGSVPLVEALVYLLVGVAGVMTIFGCGCEKCKDGVCEPKQDGGQGSSM